MSELESCGLTRADLLLVDELCDEVEDRLRSNESFELEQFLSRVDNDRVRNALRIEVAAIESRIASDARTRFDSNAAGDESICVPLTPGTVVDSFELIESIGRGATSVVWKARHLKLDRLVALKFPIASSQKVLERLSRESQAVAKLRHPNIVAIHEIRTDGKRGFLVSDYIEGRSLQERIEKGNIPTAEVVEVMIAISEAIAYSHSMHVVHRDIKPQNILLDSDNVPYVVDFGLARILLDDQIELTKVGDVLGTPGYMSPEQAQGQANVDEKSDIYSLGVLLFQLLTGRLPFLGNVHSVISQIISEPPPRPRDLTPTVPQDLETICLTCLSKNPSDRIASARELAFELRRFQSGEPILSRPITRVERMLRWVKRHPSEAVLTGLLSACVCGLMIGAVVFAMMMNDARKKEYGLRVAAENSEQIAIRLKVDVENALLESETQKAIAQRRAIESESSAEFLKSVFREPAEPFMWVLNGDGNGRGEPPTLEKLFLNAASRIESEFHGNDATKANLMDILADSCRSLGFFDLTEKLAMSARELRASVETKSDSTFTPSQRQSNQFDKLNNSVILAKLKHDSGQFELARLGYQSCIELAGQVSGEFEHEAKVLQAELLFHLGRLHLNLQENDEGRACFEKAIEWMEGQPRSNDFLMKACRLAIEYSELKPGEIPETGSIAEYFRNDSWARRLIEEFTYVLSLRAKGDWAEASQKYRVVLETLRERLPEEHPWHLLALGDYAGLQLKAGYYDDARIAIEVAIKHGNRVAPSHPDLVHAKIRLGKELVRGNRFSEGLVYLESAFETIRSNSKGKEISLDLWLVLIELYPKVGRHSEAIDLSKDLYPRINTWTAAETAWFRHLESKLYPTESEQAQSLRKASIETAYSVGDLPENGIWCERLATIFLDAKDYPRAIAASRASIGFDARSFFPEHPRVANRRVFLANCLNESGDRNAAKIEYRKALEIREKFLHEGNPLISDLQAKLDRLELEDGEVESTRF